MTWWQTLLIASVPAAVTAAGLLLQQRANTRTERLRIADGPNERAHQLGLAEKAYEHQRALADAERASEAETRRQERLDALNDHWRTERLGANHAALSALERCFTALSKYGPQYLVFEGDTEMPTYVYDEPEEELAILEEAHANVSLFCSEKSAEDFAFAKDAIESLDLQLFVNRNVTPENAEAATGYRVNVLEKIARSQARISAYRRSAKADIGTS